MSSDFEENEDIVINFDDDNSFNPVNVYVDYNLNQNPILVKSVSKEYETNQQIDNYLKGCKWSPDGSCLLTNSEDHCLRLFNLPNEFHEFNEYLSVFNPNFEMSPVLKMKENDLIYDYIWYPTMNSFEPSSCFFLSTCCQSPIHLWNAYTGQIDAIYSPYNHLEEMISSYSLAFNSDGSKIYAGFKSSIRVFDTAIPGRCFQTRQTYIEKSGQHGIISCIVVNSRKKSIYAAGSYSKQIGLYEEPNGNVICVLMGQKGGVTHLSFSSDGTKLYSGARKDPEIICWDLRKLGTILFSLKREITTNQRIYFDISSNSDLLVSGNDNGFVYIWNLSKISQHSDDESLNPVKVWKANCDSVNGVSFHPTLPLIATSSGQRKFPIQTESDDEDYMFTNKLLKTENTLRLWWLSNLKNTSEPENLKDS